MRCGKVNWMQKRIPNPRYAAQRRRYDIARENADMAPENVLSALCWTFCQIWAICPSYNVKLRLISSRMFVTAFWQGGSPTPTWITWAWQMCSDHAIWREPKGAVISAISPYIWLGYARKEVSLYPKIQFSGMSVSTSQIVGTGLLLR